MTTTPSATGETGGPPGGGAAARESLALKRPESLWQQRLLDLQLFIGTHHRLPSGMRDDPAERRLYRWLSLQCRRATVGTLPLIMMDQLETVTIDFSEPEVGPTRPRENPRQGFVP